MLLATRRLEIVGVRDCEPSACGTTEEMIWSRIHIDSPFCPTRGMIFKMTPVSRYCTWFKVGEFVPMLLCADWVVTGTWLPTSKVAGLFSMTTIDGLERIWTFDTESSADKMTSWVLEPELVSPLNPKPNAPPLLEREATEEARASPCCVVACRLICPGNVVQVELHTVFQRVVQSTSATVTLIATCSGGRSSWRSTALTLA